MISWWLTSRRSKECVMRHLAFETLLSRNILSGKDNFKAPVCKLSMIHMRVYLKLWTRLQRLIKSRDRVRTVEMRSSLDEGQCRTSKFNWHLTCDRSIALFFWILTILHAHVVQFTLYVVSWNKVHTVVHKFWLLLIVGFQFTAILEQILWPNLVE